MRIALASDHAGYKLKQELISYLSDFEVVDFGTDSPQSMDYPDIGFAAAEAVAKGECDCGIAICGSGIGMSIVTNKVKGIRAALCTSEIIAKLSRQHNDANMLVLPGRFLSFEEAKKIVDTWLQTKFDGGRHKRRINKIKKYEERR
ncbi:MAG: ribose 5-phosphate isomerase B [Candidatus Cloacimonas sp. 4484_140]|nr:MAG: ribose 5-phosphate isomerase B [Candidatus Cloacimonas sp. 4484_140]